MTRTELNQWAKERAKNLLCESPSDEEHSTLAAALVEAYEAGMERSAAICDAHAEFLSKFTPGRGAALQCASTIRAAMEEGKNG